MSIEKFKVIKQAIKEGRNALVEALDLIEPGDLTDREAVALSYLKWKANELTPSNHWSIGSYGDTCALCTTHEKKQIIECANCPLTAVDAACDADDEEDEIRTPWFVAVDDADKLPMLAALREASRWAREQERIKP